MVKIKSIIRVWLPLATVIVLLSGLIYVLVQQNYRQSANDPQIQLATDLAENLQNGKNPQELLAGNQVDLTKSLATYSIVFDDNGVPVASSGVLEGRIPTPPAGVFTYTKQNKQDKITWEPKPSIRQAAVIMHFTGSKPGFVLVGRSLKEIEKRQSQLELYTKIGVAASLIGSLIVTILLSGV